MSEVHYVLLVHGTFSAPEPGTHRWYQIGASAGNFCSRLSDELRGTPLEGGVWRSFALGEEFCWSGENDHEARLLAAERLASEFVRLFEQDPNARIHVVAHSHGGNVLLNAVEQYEDRVYAQGCRIANQLQGILSGESKAEAVQRAIADVFGDQRRVPARMSEVLYEYADFLEKLRSSEEDSEQAGLLKRFLNWLKPARDPGQAGFGEYWNQPDLGNRLGRLVFLGTPFLRKQWLVSSNHWWRVLGFISRNLHVIPFYFLLTFGLYYYPLQCARDSGETGVPPDWFLASFAVAAGVALTVSSYKSLRKYNVNFYYDVRRTRERSRRAYSSWLPFNWIKALSISSTSRDEAFLGLSSEPVVLAAIRPHVRTLLTAIGRPPPWSSATEVSGRSPTLAKEFSGSILWGVAWLGYAVVSPIWLVAKKLVLEPLVTRLLYSSVCGLAYGLPASELKGARVLVSEKINIPTKISEWNWDISSLAAASPPAGTLDSGPVVRAPSAPGEMDDQSALRKRRLEERRRHGMWATVERLMPLLFQRYRDGFRLEKRSDEEFENGRFLAKSQDVYEDEIARNWFALRDQLMAAADSIELQHAGYYSDPSVIEAVARYLATGDVPSGAEEILEHRSALDWP